MGFTLIISFADEGTEDIYNGVNSKHARSKLDRTLWRKAYLKLTMLRKASRLDDLKYPSSNHLEKLEDDLAGKYSIRINKQYRVVFGWDKGSGGAFEVIIMDYH